MLWPPQKTSQLSFFPMFLLAWIRPFAAALAIHLFTATLFGGGFFHTPPPNALTIQSAKRSHIFYVGEVVQFQISAATNRYEVHDYYGNLVDQNTISGTSFAIKVTDPGWYKLDVFGTIDQGQPWGQLVGGTMFCIFRNKAGFPALPPQDADAYNFVDDQAIRGVTGMGPQRHYIGDSNNPASDIARIQQEILVDKQMYLPFDPVRKRSLLVAFPGGTSNLTAVRQVLEAFKDDVEYFEPRNEPNFGSSGAAFVTDELIPFYQTVKSVRSTLKVMGPGAVTIGPYGLAWTEDFLRAGGGNYIDAFSFHAYNNVNGDPFLTIRSLEGLSDLLAKYNLSNIEKWQTEQGYMAAVFGAFQPRLQGRWTMLQMLIFEQYGVPKEQNHLWYDKSRGFWEAPMWWENFDSSLMPAAALMRVWSEELYGTNFSKALSFGDPGDKLYFGCLFTGPGKKVAAFMSGGSTDGRVELAVSGGNSIHYVGPWGLEYDLPVVGGRVTIPVPELPVYVEIAPGQTVDVVPVNWGSNLMLQQGVTGGSSGSGATPFPGIPNSITKLFNQSFESWYYSQTDNDWPWMDNTAGFPAWVELSLPSVQTIDRVVVYSSPPWQIWGTLVDYELQYQQNGQWTTLARVQEPLKTWKRYTSAAASTVDSFFSDRCVFQHAFAPIQTQKIRLLVHNVTWGGGANGDLAAAGGQTGPNNICLREIEVYNASALGGGSGISGNSAPLVSIYAPVDSSTYSAPATIAISASAFDDDGTIEKVEFFADGTKLGEKTSSQYGFTWNNVSQGRYTITARATDNSGAITNSLPVTITVGSNGSEPGPVIASGTGITGEYFSSPNFTSPRLRRLDPTISFDWNIGPPGPSMPIDMFTVRWTGQIEAPNTETYTFYTQSDDGCRVWVNGQKIIDNFGIHSLEEHSGTFAMLKGKRYAIVVEYLEWGGGAVVKLLWSSPSQPKNFVPTSQLYPAGSPAQPTPPPVNAPPTVTITAPGNGSIFTVPANVVFQASATDSNGTITKVEYLVDNYKIGEATNAPFSFAWNGVAAGTYVAKARAIDNLGASSLSVPITVIIDAPAVLTSASYIKTDALTKGNWKGVYGSEGANVIGNASNYPSYATVVANGKSSYTWASFTSYNAALLKLSTNERIASCWYSSNSFTIDIDFTDGRTHGLALYAMDWNDGNGTRAEKVEIFNASTGVLLDTQTITSFQQGKYVVWDIEGHIRIKVTNLTPGTNAVISGLFFGPAFGTPNPLSVAITNPLSGTNVYAPWSTIITANAANSSGNVTKVEFYSGTTKLGEDSTAPYSLNWNNVAAGTHTLTAVAYNNTDLSITSAPVNVMVIPTSATTTFVKTDIVTQGSWKGVYGADGGHVIGQAQVYPSYATVTPSGYASWTWSPSTLHLSAVEKVSSSDRIASCWYSPNSFTIDVNFTDGQTHSVALYALDWDGYGSRSQTVEILNASTGAVMDTRSLSSFLGGRYLVWDIKGHFQIRITNMNSGANAVVSGLFFGPPVSTQTGYESWAALNGLTGANSTAANDFDGDGTKNLFEWAFATDPKVSSAGLLAVNGTTIVRHGSPRSIATGNGSGGINRFAAFGRRKDFASVGLSYTGQFSNDMATWTTTTATPTVLAQDGEIEVVTVPYPPLPDGKQASFFRVIVSTP